MEDQEIERVSDPAAPWWEMPGVVPPRLCNLARHTAEFLSVGEADPSPLEPDVWLFPANSCQLEPPVVEAGFAAVAVDQATAWQIVPDYRGSTVYSTESGAAQVWQELGPLPGAFTLQAPASEFDTWQDEQWVVDEAAKAQAQSEQASRRKSLAEKYATGRITTLQDAVDLDMATDAEVAALKEWKVYRVKLSRVEVAPTAPADDAWPVSPDDTALAAWLAAQGS